MTSVPPVLDELIASLEDQLTKTEDKLREARAQIAAKDAALRQCAVVFELNDHAGMVAIIDKALEKKDG